MHTKEGKINYLKHCKQARRSAQNVYDLMQKLSKAKTIT